jgi:hypothetical protein
MEIRRAERKMVRLMAEYTSGPVKRLVFIENVSGEGMHMVTLNKGMKDQFFPGKSVELKLGLASGERIPLRCEVRWVSAERPPYATSYGVGLEIIDPPSQYVSFVTSPHPPLTPPP